jgi:5-bromo-4-chloroindolyl phosphate hydrolysis protein
VASSKGIGEQIGDAVEDALNNQDFSKIQDMVMKGADLAARGIGEGVAQAAETSRRAYESFQRAQTEMRTQEEIERVTSTRFVDTSSDKVAGGLMTALGTVFALGFGFGALVTLLGAVLVPTGILNITTIALFVLTGASVGVAVAGIRRLGLIKRFTSYRKAIGTTESISLDSLSQRASSPENVIEKDIPKMLDKGMFLQGHLDRDTETLFLTESSFQEFQQRKEEAARERQRENLKQKAAGQQSKERPLTSAERERLDEGHELLQQIEARIPDLSDNVQKRTQAIHVVAKSILERAEQDPDAIENLDQLVDYYLPLTIKLLGTYTELAAQPIQSESIAKSRQEIEKTLDTLVHAFAKLHDSLFRDMTWDVSTDISVLNAVLAQDGLTDDPFENKAGDNHE